MWDLGYDGGAAEDASSTEHCAVYTGKVTDISMEHNASFFSHVLYEHFLDTFLFARWQS